MALIEELNKIDMIWDTSVRKSSRLHLLENSRSSRGAHPQTGSVVSAALAWGRC